MRQESDYWFHICQTFGSVSMETTFSVSFCNMDMIFPNGAEIKESNIELRKNVSHYLIHSLILTLLLVNGLLLTETLIG